MKFTKIPNNKIFYLLISFLILNAAVYAQADSTKEKEPRYFYLAANVNVSTNTIGTISKRAQPSFEYGRTYGIFDIGVAVGHLNFLNSDSSWFIEFRPTINIFSKGRFSEGLCLGFGYKIKSEQKLMTEICNSINFNITNKWSISILQGYYYFDGVQSNSTSQFFGLNLTHNFLNKNSVNFQRKTRSLLN